MHARLALALVMLAGCPDWGTVPPPKPLTPDYLADPGNCWAVAVAQLAACMPLRGSSAKLSADRSTCTFADGVVVTFEQPVPLDAPEAGLFAWHVDSPTVGECGRVAADLGADGRFAGSSGSTLAVSAQTDASVTIYPNDVYELACGYGNAATTYATTPEAVDRWPPQTAPNVDLALSAASITFAIEGGTTSGPLFTCE